MQASERRLTLHLVHASATSPRTRKHRAGVRDSQVQRAIELMGSQLERRWTVSALARSVGLSRPAFARRFVESTGLSPLRYLTRCRMERAAELLRDSDLHLAGLAEQVGYSSEFAFNRAFRRHHRVAPGSYRRQLRTGGRPVFRLAA
jgi:transcriptional regulator GlxA family with amidase domain